MKRRIFIQTLVFSSGYLLLNPELKSMHPLKDDVMIKMIYNNTGECAGLENAWGLSVWIEQPGETLLFDTGGDADILINNLQAANLDPGKLSKVIISHDHWDHKNGLEKILALTHDKPELFIVAEDEKKYRKDFPGVKITPVSGPQALNDQVWTTGQIKGRYMLGALWEQSLLLVHDNAMVILTGCSHPGIITIVQRAQQVFPQKEIRLVAGGFHLKSTGKEKVQQISDTLKELGVQRIAPSHCTGGDAIELFRSEWGDRFLAFDLGDTLPGSVLECPPSLHSQ